MIFVLGVGIGAAAMVAFFVWSFLRRESPTTLVDMWWAQNPERWASLRDILLAERENEEAAR